MSTNCYNGCAQIVSDKCVEYTGDNVPLLGIETNDTLLSVENTLVSYIITLLNGSGIIPVISPSELCPIVTEYLPSSGTIDLNEYITAIVKAICSVKNQADASTAAITALNANYSIGCLSGVTSSSDTHEIVQAIITKLCQQGVDLAALAIDVDSNYVKLADINSLISAYLNSISIGTQEYLKMVPYTVVEYYGNLTGYPTVSDGFNLTTGVGYGSWQKVYLCNGLNGTPDKRGRVPVGVTTGVGGGAFDPSVDPTIVGNPTYTINTKYGANTVTLNSTQIPAHTHTITDPGHYTDIKVYPSISSDWRTADGSGNPVSGIENVAFGGLGTVQTATTTTKSYTGINSTNSVGSGGSHNNAQPALACYYIMYIP